MESESVGAAGSLVSTLTVVETETVLPTLSVPVSVYRQQPVERPFWSGLPLIAVGEPNEPQTSGDVKLALARINVEEARPEAVAF